MDSNEDEGVEDFSEEELRLPEGYDDEGSSAISDQDYMRADDVPKDDASAANKVIWEAHMNKQKRTLHYIYLTYHYTLCLLYNKH